jgi:hypothetical protein
VHRWVGRRRRVLPPPFVASLTLSGSAYCRALRGGHEVATGEPDLGHASGGSRMDDTLTIAGASTRVSFWAPGSTRPLSSCAPRSRRRLRRW